MKCLDDCHTYELETFMKPTIADLEKLLDGPPKAIQILPNGSISSERVILKFYNMKEDGTKIDGVTNEEVLKVLIHRLKFLNEQWQDGKFRCGENVAAISDLEDALFWLNKRTADRLARNVEATYNV